MNTPSALPRSTTLVSPVTIFTPASRAASPMLCAMRWRSASGKPSSRMKLAERCRGRAPAMARSLIVPCTRASRCRRRGRTAARRHSRRWSWPAARRACRKPPDRCPAPEDRCRKPRGKSRRSIAPWPGRPSRGDRSTRPFFTSSLRVLRRGACHEACPSSLFAQRRRGSGHRSSGRRRSLRTTPCRSPSASPACRACRTACNRTGFFTPRRIAPHSQAGLSLAGNGLDVEDLFRVEGGEFLAQFQRADRAPAPRPRHSKVSRSSNTRATISCALTIAVGRHRADIFVLDLGAALVDLAHQHQDRLHHVERLEAGDHHRLAVILRRKADRARCRSPSRHGPGRRKPSMRHGVRAPRGLPEEPESRPASARGCRRRRNSSAPRLCAFRSAMAVGGVVVSKPMAKNTTLRSGSSRAMRKASSVE